MKNKLKFSHFCKEWDGMEIDETCDEFEVCLCYDQNNFMVGINKALIRVRVYGYGEKELGF